MTKRGSPTVARRTDGYWEWFLSTEEPAYRVGGKYLFFSKDRELLTAIAIEEITRGGFHRAKTHMAGVAPPSGEFVLCLYYSDDSRQHELASKYRELPGVNYRYWKSEQATRERQYSKEFLSKLTPERRAQFRKESED